MINRRGLITGLISFVAAPAIVRVQNIMPVKVVRYQTVEEIINRVLQVTPKFDSFNWNDGLIGMMVYMDDEIFKITSVSQMEFYRHDHT